MPNETYDRLYKHNERNRDAVDGAVANLTSYDTEHGLDEPLVRIQKRLEANSDDLETYYERCKERGQ